MTRGLRDVCGLSRDVCAVCSYPDDALVEVILDASPPPPSPSPSTVAAASLVPPSPRPPHGSTDRDEGEGGRLRRGIGVNRLRVSRLSNAQRIGVRVGRLVSSGAQAQPEAQHQQRHRAYQQIARP